MAVLDVLFDERPGRPVAAGFVRSAMDDLARAAKPADPRGARPRPAPSASRWTLRACPRAWVVERLLARGILSKDTHETVVRIAPPLNVEEGVARVGRLGDRRDDLTNFKWALSSHARACSRDAAG